jgi:hypothetical protein
VLKCVSKGGMLVPANATHALIDPDSFVEILPGYGNGINSQYSMVWGKKIQGNIIKHLVEESNCCPNVAFPVVGSQSSQIEKLVNMLLDKKYQIDIYYAHTENASLAICNRSLEIGNRIISPKLPSINPLNTFVSLASASDNNAITFNAVQDNKTLLHTGEVITCELPDIICKNKNIHVK